MHPDRHVPDIQGSVVVVYNWLQREHLSPHTWVTDYMADLHLNVNFVGISTQDRRHLYPQKEVSLLLACTMLIGYSKSLSALDRLMNERTKFVR